VSDSQTFNTTSPSGPAPQPQALTTSQDAFIHALIGAQFGDLEFDVGKSVRWTQWFSDDLFITDINTGDQRYWVVNWDKTFPFASHTTTDINFFVVPAQFRAAQFAAALKDPVILLEDNDWVLFVDAHEGMSCDTRSLPNDVGTEPFRSYVFREITRAQGAGKDHVVFPFLAFLRHADVGNVEYETPALQGMPKGFSTVQQSVGIPYYLANQGLARLWLVSSLKAPGFDWTQLDTFQAVSDPNVKLQLVSYAYAHWNEQDIVPPATEVPPLDATNDDGWRQRQLISRVRAIPGLPYSDPWKPPSADVVGDPGPWAGDQTGTPDVGTWNDGTIDNTVGTATALYQPDYPGNTSQFNINALEPWRTVMKLAVTDTTAQGLIVGVGSAPDFAWSLGFDAGSLTMQFSTDGTAVTTATLATAAQLQMTDGEIDYIGVEMRTDPKTAQMSIQALRSDDGETWVEVGTAYSVPWVLFWQSQSDLLVSPDPVLPAKICTILSQNPDTGQGYFRFDADDKPANQATWVGLYGNPWSLDDASAITQGYVTPLVPPAPTTATAGVLTPLYDLVFRINLRDGVWYDAGQLGNVPLIWNDATQTWDPVVEPADWAGRAYVQQP